MSHTPSTPDPHALSTEAGNASSASSDDAPPAKSWVWLTLLAGHLSAALYVLAGILALVAVGSAVSEAPEDDFAELDAIGLGAFAAIGFASALLVEFVTIGVHRRRKWAWFAGLALFAFMSLSVLSPIGAVALCGLLMRGSRREFGIGGMSDGRRQDARRIDSLSDQGSSPLHGKLSSSSSKLGSTADAPSYGAPPGKSWVWLAIIGGHLGAAFHGLFAIGMLTIVGFAVADIPDTDGSASVALVFGSIALVSLTLAVGAEVVTIGMHRRRQWAWFAGFAMFVLYLGFLIPVGALGLCGLLMSGSRQEFGIA